MLNLAERTLTYYRTEPEDWLGRREDARARFLLKHKMDLSEDYEKWILSLKTNSLLLELCIFYNKVQEQYHVTETDRQVWDLFLRHMEFRALPTVDGQPSEYEGLEEAGDYIMKKILCTHLQISFTHFDAEQLACEKFALEERALEELELEEVFEQLALEERALEEELEQLALEEVDYGHLVAIPHAVPHAVAVVVKEPEDRTVRNVLLGAVMCACLVFLFHMCGVIHVTF